MTSVRAKRSSAWNSRIAGAMAVVLALGSVSPALAAKGPCLNQVLRASLDSYIGLSYPKTLGIEVEGMIPKKLGYEGFVRAVRVEMLKQFPDARVEFDQTSQYKDKFHARIRYTRNGELGEIRFHIDQSVRVPSDFLPIEIASPVLRGMEDFRTYLGTIGIMKEIGLRGEPTSAGIHIHVGFFEPRSGDTAATALVFAKIERKLMKLFATHSYRKDFTRPTSAKVLNAIAQGLPESHDIRDFMARLLWAPEDRYHAMNLRALKSHGTVEFRLFNSTVDLEGMELMGDFALGLVTAVRGQDPRLIRYLETTKPEAVDPLGISEALGLKLHQRPDVLQRLRKEVDLNLLQLAANSPVWRDPYARTVLILGLIAAAAAAASGYQPSLEFGKEHP